METRDAGFQWMLGHFTIEQVKDAFRQYIERNSDMPVPADIINLIDPPKPKPEKLSTTEYIRIMNDVKQGRHLWGFDKEFVLAYREQQRQTVAGNQELEETNHRIEANKPRIHQIGYEGNGWEGEIE
jgi:hypothetical protein